MLFYNHTEDFTPISAQSVVFDSKYSQRDVEVTIINDLVVESDEIFTLVLSSNDSSAVIESGTNVTTLTIIDDDGLLNQSFLKNKQFF